MRTLFLASKFRRPLSTMWGLFVIAMVTPVLPETRSAEPVPPPAGQMENRSIEQNMMKQGVPPLPTRNPAPSRTSAANGEMLKAKLEEAKRDTATLAELADSLKDDVARSKESVIALSTAEKAEKIEKLAKKIKRWAKSN